MTKNRVSRAAGVVVVRRQTRAWELLCLRAYRYWDFPKGTIAAGEDPLAAAIREVAEETGLTALEFRWGSACCETEPYAGGKVARYYVAASSSGNVYLAPNPDLGRPEHHEYRWLEFDDARKLLVPRLQNVLDWARDTIGA